MKATAVICECNPFHYGHQYIFDEARKSADCVIAVMSGNYVQRAEPAIFDKYARAEALVRSGVDLVLELPFPWSSASAEYFASAGTFIASEMGANTLLFGAQSTSDTLMDAAGLFLSEEYLDYIRDLPKIGIARAREQYIKDHMGEAAAEMLRSPNDILGIEYCKALMQSESQMHEATLGRISADDTPLFRSASQLRAMFRDAGMDAIHPFLPPVAFSVMEDEWCRGGYAVLERFLSFAYYHFRMSESKAVTADGADGVLDRLHRCAAEAVCAEDMFQRAATRKYTNARFRRAALFHMLRITGEQLREKPRFTVLLAASSRGCAWLSRRRHTASIPVLTKPSDRSLLSAAATLQYENFCAADRLYTLCLHSVRPAAFYLRKSPFIWHSESGVSAF